jgi:diketogulonate reductase-like aldo/keto reductase
MIDVAKSRLDYREFGRTSFKASSIGMGTYYGVMSRVFSGDARQQHFQKDKLMALRKGIELGMNLIDTAEVYQTEELVGEAVQGQNRDELFVATKVWSSHLHYEDVLRSAGASLSKLGLNYVDLFQIHWPNDKIPIGETMRAMERLIVEGKVRFIGVSNFSVAQTKEAQEALSKHDLTSNQVEYSLLARDIEDDLLPYCKSNGVAVLAYRPVAHGSLANPGGKLESVMNDVAMSHGGKTKVQVALNWLLARGENIFPIPRASRIEHVVEDAGAAGWRLDQSEVSRLLAAAGR